VGDGAKRVRIMCLHFSFLFTTQLMSERGAAKTVEAELYPLVLRWLKQARPFQELGGNYPVSVEGFADDTSSATADTGGLWSRPDIACLVLGKGHYSPYWITDLFSFEIKTAVGLNQSAVFEALGHSRFANYSYLLWPGPEDLSLKEEAIVALAAEFGVGTVTTSDPAKASSYRVRHASQRRDIESKRIDQFVSDRFSQSTRSQIDGWLRNTGWLNGTEGQRL